MEIVIHTNSSRSQFDFTLHDQTNRGKRAKNREKQVRRSEKSQVQSLTASKIVQIKMSKLKVRIVGLFLLLVIVGVLFIQGFATNNNTGYYSDKLPQYSLVGITLTISCIFAVIGFGLLLTYYTQNTYSSILVSLYIVSLSMILNPLIQKLWLNVFLNGFKRGLENGDASYKILTESNINTNVSINYVNLKQSICCAISQLVVYVGVIGRMQIYKIILSSLVFIFFWNLNYCLCLYMLKISVDTRFFDDYSISMIYIFGGFVALVMCFDVPSNLHLKVSQKIQQFYTKITSIVGIFFIWLSFCCTSSIIGTKQVGSTINEDARVVFYPQGCFQMFFALSSSTISSLAFSYLLNPKPRVADLLNGSISGAIAFGCVASFVTNIAAPIGVGIGSAFIAVLHRSKFSVRKNKERIYDVLGSGTLLLIGIVGAIGVYPIVLLFFNNFSLLASPLKNAPLQKLGEVSWILIYAGISAGMGLVTGMIISTIVRCVFGYQTSFGDKLMFVQEQRQQQIKA